jgi:hypothetical protein
MKVFSLFAMILAAFCWTTYAAPISNPLGFKAPGYPSYPKASPDLVRAPNSLDEGGETCETAVEITAIPYTDTGNTSDNVNNYNPPFAFNGGRDVVYRYTPAVDMCLDMSLCASYYDTRLYVYQTACNGVPYRINDDGCLGPNYPGPFVSHLQGVNVTAGQTYFIVVDGFDGSSSGEYNLEIADCGPPWVPDEPCPNGAIFGQPHNEYALGWFSATSGNQCIYDNVFGLTEPICVVEFWGGTATGQGEVCGEDPLTFQIAFRTDSAGYPGTLVASYQMTILREPDGEYNGFPLYKYSAPLNPCLIFSEGWMSVQTVTDPVPNCAFVWWSFLVGDCVGWLRLNGTYYRPYSDQSFCLLPSLGAEPVAGTLPTQYALHQNYPNPFNASTTIAFDLPKSSHICLRVFDLLGREVAVLKDGMMEAGSHRVTFDGSNLASGIYFARLDAGKFSQTKKVILLK